MKYPITREGFDGIKKDIEYLRNTKRPKILWPWGAPGARRYLRERGV